MKGLIKPSLLVQMFSHSQHSRHRLNCLLLLDLYYLRNDNLVCQQYLGVVSEDDMMLTTWGGPVMCVIVTNDNDNQSKQINFSMKPHRLG